MTGEITRNHETNRVQNICTETGNQVVKILYCSNKSKCIYRFKSADMCLHVNLFWNAISNARNLSVQSDESHVPHIQSIEVQIVFLHSKNSLCEFT